MKVIQGTIAQVHPPDYTNQHGVQYQNIVVNTTSGPIHGRLGTKQPYGLQDIGQAGQWELEQAQNQQGAYNKLKKYNPQQGQYQGGSTAKNPEDARGKVRHGVVCAFIQSGRQPEFEDVEYWVNYIMSGNIQQPVNTSEADEDIGF